MIGYILETVANENQIVTDPVNVERRPKSMKEKNDHQQQNTNY